VNRIVRVSNVDVAVTNVITKLTHFDQCKKCVKRNRHTHTQGHVATIIYNSSFYLL